MAGRLAACALHGGQARLAVYETERVGRQLFYRKEGCVSHKKQLQCEPGAQSSGAGDRGGVPGVSSHSSAHMDVGGAALHASDY